VAVGSHRPHTALWVALAAVVFALSLGAGVLSILAITDGDRPSDRRNTANSPTVAAGTGLSAPEQTVALGERLSVAGVADVRVLRVKRSKRAPARRGYRPRAATGVWTVVTLEVTNRTRQTQTVSGAVLEIEDNRDIYTGPGGEGASQELFLPSALHTRELRPGQTAAGALAYDVAPGFKPLRLRVPHSWRVLDVDDPKVPVSYVELTRR
jgi:Domain of unknown function (DUF4352)